MCKDKNYYNLQKKKLSKKKKFNFKLEKTLKILNVLKILRDSKLVIFLQYRSLRADHDLKLNLFFFDQSYIFKIITKNCIEKIINPQFLKQKKFSALLSISCLEDKLDIEKILKKNDIGILGYYYNNIFFSKKDFNITALSTAALLTSIFEFKSQFYKYLRQVIIILKNWIYLLYSVLAYRKGVWPQ